MSDNVSRPVSDAYIPHQEDRAIRVYGARVNNLKNIDVVIPHHSLTVITGVSGSGKSSLAFDTIYAEGQRRYMETMSAYARQFLGNMERPDVDRITGLSPVIAIEQKTTNRNPRSTVGTITEIYDFLRLLYARASEAFSSETGEKMVKYSDDQIVDLILQRYQGQPVYLLAPVVRGRKGHYKELFEQIRRRGFLHVSVDGELMELRPNMRVDRYKIHFIDIVIDKMVIEADDRKRLKMSVETAMKQGKGVMRVQVKDQQETRFYSRKLMCPTTGISYDDPAPYTFSFNSPQGACPHCNGLGVITEVDITKLIPDTSVSRSGSASSTSSFFGEKKPGMVASTRSSRRRSSGWNRITSAISPSSTARRSRRLIIVRPSAPERASAITITKTPRASLKELVRRTSIINL